MTNKILFVDDEPLVLDGYRRMLHRDFEVDTAEGGEQGLLSIHDRGPYAVIISDMRMPGMNGAQFLSQVKQKYPQTVRMLLTGYSDMNAAIEAINEGQIFRFLTKPCEKAVLAGAIQLGLDQFHLAKSEKEGEKKAPVIEQPKFDISGVCQFDEFDSPTGLGGPAQAKKLLASLPSSDPHNYAVLLKLILLSTIEHRYGEDAARDYLNSAAQFLIESMRSEDRFFHLGQDLLMAVISRQISAAATRMEIARRTSVPRECILHVDGRSIVMTCPITFDLLPVAQFPTIDQLLASFDATLMDKPL